MTQTESTGAPDLEGAPRARKSEQTKARIVDAALALFLEHGYEGTTMRAIAKAAEVSVGNAYYYFESKEHLIQAYYGQIQELHLGAARPVLDTERGFAERLRGVLRAHIDTVSPYHQFAGVLFKTAADPRSPLSPFSAESSGSRERSIGLFTELLEGSDAKVGKDLRTELPELLWLYQMGIVLYWVHDDSPGTARTYTLIDRTTPLVDKLISISRLPVLRPMTRLVVETIRDLRSIPSS
ncbi:MAG: TetR family transcriptional regulator [Mycobacteriales bacterium]